jgi:hypothetical protein
MVLRLTMVSLNLLGREDLDGVALRALVALQRENQIGTPVEDLACDGARAPLGVDGLARILAPSNRQPMPVPGLMPVKSSPERTSRKKYLMILLKYRPERCL